MNDFALAAASIPVRGKFFCLKGGPRRPPQAEAEHQRSDVQRRFRRFRQHDDDCGLRAEAQVRPSAVHRLPMRDGAAQRQRRLLLLRRIGPYDPVRLPGKFRR